MSKQKYRSSSRSSYPFTPEQDVLLLRVVLDERAHLVTRGEKIDAFERVQKRVSREAQRHGLKFGYFTRVIEGGNSDAKSEQALVDNDREQAGSDGDGDDDAGAGEQPHSNGPHAGIEPYPVNRFTEVQDPSARVLLWRLQKLMRERPGYKPHEQPHRRLDLVHARNMLIDRLVRERFKALKKKTMIDGQDPLPERDATRQAGHRRMQSQADDDGHEHVMQEREEPEREEPERGEPEREEPEREEPEHEEPEREDHRTYEQERGHEDGRQRRRHGEHRRTDPHTQTQYARNHETGDGHEIGYDKDHREAGYGGCAERADGRLSRYELRGSGRHRQASQEGEGRRTRSRGMKRDEPSTPTSGAVESREAYKRRRLDEQVADALHEQLGGGAEGSGRSHGWGERRRDASTLVELLQRRLRSDEEERRRRFTAEAEERNWRFEIEARRVVMEEKDREAARQERRAMTDLMVAVAQRMQRSNGGV